MDDQQRSLLLKASSHTSPPQGPIFTQLSKVNNFLILISDHFLFFSFVLQIKSGAQLSYGTAGFRADASLLESTVYRMGVLAALRSFKTGSVTGLVITASHNQISDNGIKVADPSGGMLTQEWEPFANALANAPDSQGLLLVSLLCEFHFFN